VTDSELRKAALGVRELARRGILATEVRAMPHSERRLLRIEAYEIVWPVVFHRLTRRLETGRGHHRCASSVRRLEQECLDRFHDDVDAVLDDLFGNAKVPIANLEGWVSRRITAATVNAHRRRRGERGALQRPRLPGWLADALGHEPRLLALAVDLLVWVGVETTAGTQLWPLDAWAERRGAQTGDHQGAHRTVTEDVAAVLAAMRRRPTWYQRYVERPLGRKQAPLRLVSWTTRPDSSPEPSYLSLSGHDIDDARLLERAAAAVTTIEARLARSEDPRAVVVDVLTTVFDPGTGAEELDRCPGSGPDAGEMVTALLADPATLDRVVSVVRELSTRSG
jgi:hypothetical protein